MKIVCICLICVFWVFTHSQANTFTYQFDNYNIEEGLSFNRVNSITQDDLGFIWVGTSAGLNRFEGNGFKTFYQPKVFRKNTTVNQLKCVKKRLWVGTTNGLYSIDLKTEQIRNEIEINQKLNHKGVSAIVHNNDKVWVSSGARLFEIELNNDTSMIAQSQMKRIELPASKIENLALSDSGIWIGTRDYLLFHNLNNSETVNYTRQLFSSRKNIRITALYVDSQKQLWVATTKGLFKKKLKGDFINLSIQNSSSILNEVVSSIGEDKYGNILLVTWQKGLITLRNGDYKQIQTFNNESQSASKISDNDINTIFTDREGIVWIGFSGNGVDKLTYIPQYFRFYQSSENITDWIGPHGISSLAEEDDDYFWASSGTSGSGLFRFNKKTGKAKYFYHPDENPANYCINYISVYDRVLWIHRSPSRNLHAIDLNTLSFCTPPLLSYIGREARVNYFSKHDSTYWVSNDKHYFNQIFTGDAVLDYSKLNHQKDIYYLKPRFIDSKGNFWLKKGSYEILKYNPKEQEEFLFSKKNDPKYLLSSYDINTICEDQNDNIWIGTHNGLNKIDLNTNEVTQIKGSYGKQFNNAIYSLTTDKQGRIWVATKNQLAYINEKDSIVAFIGRDFGIENIKFNYHSCMRGKDGKIYLGTENQGVVAFDPKVITTSAFEQNVVITKLDVNNQPYNLTNTAVSRLKEIDLKHNQNSLTFTFEALSNYLPNTFRYAYRLRGLQQDWQYTSPQNRTINYSNLASGSYILQLKVAKADGVWSDIKELHIHIATPWWQTIWAYLFYLFCIVALVRVTWRYSMQQVALKEQLKAERIRREQELELNNMKLSFFTNISHEFRTPLTLLLGQLEILMNNSALDSQKRINKYEIMQRNANRLLRLINQILDFRKAENRKLKLKTTQCDLVNLLAEISIPFEQMAIQQNISFKFESNQSEAFLQFDVDKVDKVIHNLLSNALKFTSQNGEIRLELQLRKGYADIRVADTGIGIAPKHLEHIFTRFYQVDNSSGKQGSGIGLAFANDLAKIMKGTLHVESKEQEGSIFTLTIPVSEASQISETSDSAAPNNQLSNSESEEIETSNNQLKIMVVDDDLDMLNLLSDNFCSMAEVITAQNGSEALDIAITQLPDLIISDVMMPVMDGNEFCKKLRADIRISHIPVILLTARTLLEHQIEGIEHGADSYITKPFNLDYLKTRVTQLIQLRKNLRQQFTTDIDHDQPNIANELPNREHQFIAKVKKLVEDNMSNPQFSIEQIYREVGMSRTHFFKKIKTLTGKTANDFIKTVKMKHAAHLLKQSDVRINEVAWAVGFADPKYFSKVFKTYFGMTPSEYVNNDNQSKD